MVSPKETLAELQWLSERMSSQVRTIALGLLAVCWGLLVSQPPNLLIRARSLLFVILVAMLALMADLLQYGVGYLNTLRHHRYLVRHSVEQDYDRTAPLYRLRVALFWAKQILTGIALVALLTALLPSLATQD